MATHCAGFELEIQSALQKSRVIFSIPPPLETRKRSLKNSRLL